MTIIATDLRNTQESAKRLRFESTSLITATNVQDAIQQAAASPATITPTPVTFGMSPYTPLISDTLLLVNTSAGAITIALTAAATRNGAQLTIKDDTGNAVANPISIVRSGAETIDGLTTYPIDSSFGAVTLQPQAGGYAVV